MSKSIKFVLGAILGGIAGASAAILLAPGSGDETRNAVKAKIAGLANEFKTAMQNRRTELENELKNLKEME